jgi:hypothetical protein
MKQTAVEWLLNKVWDLDNDYFTVPNELIEMLENAKEMEKQQIIDAYWGSSNFDSEAKEGEKYYNETFKKQQ